MNHGADARGCVNQGRVQGMNQGGDSWLESGGVGFQAVRIRGGGGGVEV